MTYIQIYQCPHCGKSVHDYDEDRLVHTQECPGIRELAKQIAIHLKEAENGDTDEWGRQKGNGYL